MDLKNMGLAVESSYLSYLEPEIKVFPVWRSPSLIFHFQFRPTSVSVTSAIGFPDPKDMQIFFGLSTLASIESKIFWLLVRILQNIATSGLWLPYWKTGRRWRVKTRETLPNSSGMTGHEQSKEEPTSSWEESERQANATRRWYPSRNIKLKVSNLVRRTVRQRSAKFNVLVICWGSTSICMNKVGFLPWVFSVFYKVIFNFISLVRTTLHYRTSCPIAQNAHRFNGRYLQVMLRCEQEGIVPFGELTTPPTIDVPAYCTKLMTVDPATFADELSAASITFPCALVQCGSATACPIVSELLSVVVGIAHF